MSLANRRSIPHATRVTRARAVALISMLAALSGFASTPAMAQSLECVRPAMSRGICALRLDSPNATETIVLRVVDALGKPITDAEVVLEFHRGAVTPTGVVRTNAAGLAAFVWSDNDIREAIDLQARAIVGEVAFARAITLQAPPLRAPTAMSLGRLTNNDRVWYVERQIPWGPGVEILNNGQSKMADRECTSTFVMFKQFNDGGSAPDSVPGAWNKSDSTCAATARWRLGKEVGEQYLRAELSGEPAKQVRFSAVARALPHLSLGLALSAGRSVWTKHIDRKTISVSQTVGSEALRFDRVVDSVSAKKKSAGQFAPVLGIDWAPWLPATRLRVSLGPSIVNAQNEWYLGASILQWLQPQGMHREAVGIDVQGVVQFSRRQIVRNPDACNAGRALCDVDNNRLRPTGVGVMVELDGTTLLSQLIAAFPALP
ncbi:MAG TPA: hypothetical protein VGM50_17525 [Gemmatimonadaceae bacterium]